MDIAVAEEIPAQLEGGIGDAYRKGLVERTHLLAGTAPDGLRFRLFLSKYNSGEQGFESPRHHHGFQQIRWAESGSVNFAPDKDIADGDLAYFPKGTYYGPQLKNAGVSLLLQFGMNDEIMAKSVEEYRAGAHLRELKQGIEKLQSRGRIEDGAFIEKDAATGSERREDPGELIARESGIKLAIPPERYHETILIHPRAFQYFELAEGVEQRRFGSFFDHQGPDADVRIFELRLSDGEYELSPERAQIGWTVSEGLEIDGRTYPRMTCFYSPLGESAKLCGSNEAEMIVVEFPRTN
jgi:hypothetical protein